MGASIGDIYYVYDKNGNVIGYYKLEFTDPDNWTYYDYNNPEEEYHVVTEDTSSGCFINSLGG
jgi:hypothetical protein